MFYFLLYRAVKYPFTNFQMPISPKFIIRFANKVKGHKKGRKAFLSLWWTHVIGTDYDSIVKVADYNITDVIREEFKKKFGKSIYLFIYLFGKSIFCQTGGGQRGWWKNQTVFLKKVFFRVYRIILGPPKHVLHLFWSASFISTAVRTIPVLLEY